MTVRRENVEARPVERALRTWMAEGGHMDSDADLMRRYRAGDAEAFDLLVRRHIDLVYAAALRQMGEASAADITQAVFLLLMKRRPSWHENASLVGWLYRATGYCCANSRKSESRRRRREQEVSMETSRRQESGRESAGEQAILEELDRAIAGLRERERVAVLLRYLEEKSYLEVGAALGISEEAARKRADRGVEKLREIFGRRGKPVGTGMVTAGLASAATLKAPVALASAVVAGTGATSAAVAVAQGAGTVMAWGKAKVAALLLATLCAGGSAVAVVGMAMHQGPAPVASGATSLPASQPATPTPAPATSPARPIPGVPTPQVSRWYALVSPQVAKALKGIAQPEPGASGVLEAYRAPATEIRQLLRNAANAPARAVLSDRGSMSQRLAYWRDEDSSWLSASR